MAFLTLGSNATFAFPIKRTYAGPLDHYTRVEYINDLFNPRIIQNANPYEGMQVYITKGSQWIGVFDKIPGSTIELVVPDGWGIINKSTDTQNRYIVTNDQHKGEIWVLQDLNKLTNPIIEMDWSNWVETLKPDSGWKKLGSDANLQWEQL